MADRRALTVQSGTTKQIQDADNLIVGAGIRTSAGGLSVVSATGAVSIGTIAALTTLVGDAQVNGTTTLAITTVNGAATFNANVTIGDGVGTDSLAFNAASGRLGSAALPDVKWIKEVNHIFSVDASTTAVTAGGNLTILPGNGNGAAGGNLVLDAATGTSNGVVSIGATNSLQILLGRAAASSVFTGTSLACTYSLGISETRNAIGVGQSSGLQLVNNTAATAGGAAFQQWSPGLMLTGQQWTGAASIPVDWMLQTKPEDSVADAGSMSILSRRNAGAWNRIIDIEEGAGSPMIRGGSTTGTLIQFGTALLLQGQNGFVLPTSDNGMACGLDGVLGWNCVSASWLGTHSGTQLTAANTITPVYSMHHITGATVVKTIAVTNLPTNFNGVLTLIADTNGSWDATANIALAGNFVQFQAQDFVWDRVAVKWYPKAQT